MRYNVKVNVKVNINVNGCKWLHLPAIYDNVAAGVEDEEEV